MLIIILALYNSVSIPFTTAFPTDEAYFFYDLWENFIDCIFFVDVIINFRTTFVNGLGDEVFNPKLIAKTYVYKGRFFLDLLASVPFE